MYKTWRKKTTILSFKILNICIYFEDHYVWYTPFSMCLYISKFLRTVNKLYFCLFCFEFASYKFALTLHSLSAFTSCGGEFFLLHAMVSFQF